MSWLNQLDLWPSYMRPIVSEYGGGRVYRIGLDVLGFPPLWNPSERQVSAIIEAIKREDFDK